jgi:MOSC domain-containing protein YiiM
MTGPVAAGLAELMGRFAGEGRLDWIGLRPARRSPVVPVPAVGITDAGLEGDRQTRPNARSVTLMQAEHLPVIAALAGLPAVAPETLRRNLLISGLNLAALRGRLLRVGPAVLRITGPCAPCSRMEEALGHGGYTAMRSHGGWCAEVVTTGQVVVGMAVRPAAA